MADRSELIVGGYYFGSYDDAKIAQKEIKNAKYLNERTGNMPPNQMKAVYDKMIDEKVFGTPVGWEYLKYLKECLIEAGIPEDEIRPIPLYCNFTLQKKDIFEKDSHIARNRIRSENKKGFDYKSAFKMAMGVCAVLSILVLLMFIITVKSDNPNVLNYEKAVVDKYAEWEDNLKDREKAIREKEKALNISDEELDEEYEEIDANETDNNDLW